MDQIELALGIPISDKINQESEQHTEEDTPPVDTATGDLFANTPAFSN